MFVAKPENKRPFLVGWRDKSTTDPEIVKEWFKQWPNALPAIDLAKSGHVVIDGDRHGGPDGVCHAEHLFAERGLIATAIPTVVTPQNGRHYWFTQPTEGEPIGNSDKPVRDKGINVRGAGGYVIAPGALLRDGKEYRRDPNTPSIIEAVRNGTVPVLPPSIVTLLRPNGHAAPPPAKPAHSGAREEAYAQVALGNVASEIAKAPSGSRNIELNNGALRMGHMVASGWIGRATVEGRLFDAAQPAAWSMMMVLIPSARQSRAGLMPARRSHTRRCRIKEQNSMGTIKRLVKSRPVKRWRRCSQLRHYAR